MFRGIHFGEFLNSFEEWHSLVFGVCAVLCPFTSRYKPSTALAKQIEDEYHYYQVGRVLGILLWIVIAWVIKEIF